MSHDSKRQLLTHSHAGRLAAGLSDAIVIKDEDVFFLCRRDGSVPVGEVHGLGLYFHDCRYLSGYEVMLCGKPLEPLAATGTDGFRSVFELTNPEISPEKSDRDGDRRDAGSIARQKIVLRWRHVLDAERHALRDELTLENYDLEAHELSLEIALEADFRDVFALRGLIDLQPGRMRKPRWHGDELVFAYEGADGVQRKLLVRFSEQPTWRRGTKARFRCRLGPHDRWRLVFSFALVETEQREGSPHVSASQSDVDEAERLHIVHRSTEEWMKGFAEVQSESMWLDRTINRSLRDLRALRTSLDEEAYFAAGIPWFATLFGRDSLICALQTLAYRRNTAAETLRLLAKFQGTKDDPWREEQPGRILHELRSGELARAGVIPYTPYYGTVDATPLFVVLLGEYTRWAGSLDLFEELSAALDAALGWIDAACERGIDGYLAYDSVPGQRLVNQGWKDSGDAIIDSQGRTAEPPVALVEVQGYVYLAWLEAAELFERSGDTARGQELRRRAAELRTRFNRDFWLEDRRFYALALQKGGRPVDSITSNPGHALWTGIVDPEREASVVERLMCDDMFSGWGVRTLATSEAAYNPVGYHLGTVWPHDNSILAAGFQRCGHAQQACRVLSGLLLAATHFRASRLPEAFAGCSRDDLDVPVRYPVACQPQAWACGAVPFLLQAMLGLVPDGFEKRLRLVKPTLPDFLAWLRVKRLRVADAEVDLLFERDRGGGISFTIERLDGELEVTLQER